MATLLDIGYETQRCIVSYLVPEKVWDPRRCSGAALENLILFHQDAWWVGLARRGCLLPAQEKQNVQLSQAIWQLFEDGGWSFPDEVGKRTHIEQYARLHEFRKFLEKVQVRRTHVHNCPCRMLGNGRPQLGLTIAKQFCHFTFGTTRLRKLARKSYTAADLGCDVISHQAYSTSSIITELPALAVRLVLTRSFACDSSNDVQSEWMLGVMACLSDSKNRVPEAQTELAIQAFVLNVVRDQPLLKTRFYGYDDDYDMSGLLSKTCVHEASVVGVDALRGNMSIHCAVVVSVCSEMRFGKFVTKKSLCRQHQLWQGDEGRLVSCMQAI